VSSFEELLMRKLDEINNRQERMENKQETISNRVGAIESRITLWKGAGLAVSAIGSVIGFLVGVYGEVFHK
jgi:hypothetical protein